MNACRGALVTLTQLLSAIYYNYNYKYEQRPNEKKKIVLCIPARWLKNVFRSTGKMHTMEIQVSFL